VVLKSPAAASKFDLVREWFGDDSRDVETSPALIGDNEGCHRSIEVPPFTGCMGGASWDSNNSWSHGLDICPFNVCELLNSVDWLLLPFVDDEGMLERESVTVLAERSRRRPSPDVSLPRSDDSI
jgi:hypothetical protein